MEIEPGRSSNMTSSNITSDYAISDLRDVRELINELLLLNCIKVYVTLIQLEDIRYNTTQCN